MVKTAWEVNPAVAVYMTERFQLAQAEVGRLIRAHPDKVLHVPEALHFLLGKRLDPTVRRSLKVRQMPGPG
jgi:phosphatidylinositol 4-kinase A